MDAVRAGVRCEERGPPRAVVVPELALGLLSGCLADGGLDRGAEAEVLDAGHLGLRLRLWLGSHEHHPELGPSAPRLSALVPDGVARGALQCEAVGTVADDRRGHVEVHRLLDRDGRLLSQDRAVDPQAGVVRRPRLGPAVVIDEMDPAPRAAPGVPPGSHREAQDGLRDDARADAADREAQERLAHGRAARREPRGGPEVPTARPGVYVGVGVGRERQRPVGLRSGGTREKHERQHQAPGPPDIIGRSPAGVESKQGTTRWFAAAEAAFVTS